MKTKSLLFKLAAVLLVPLFLTGCPDDDDDDPVPLVTPIGNVEGNWSITETQYGSPCGDFTSTFGYTVTAYNQSGNSLTVDAPTDVGIQAFTGTISGNKLWWTGSYPDDGGTTTITSMNLTIASDCNSFSGTTNWTWSDNAGYTCSSYSDVVGSRITGSGC